MYLPVLLMVMQQYSAIPALHTAVQGGSGKPVAGPGMVSYYGKMCVLSKTAVNLV